MSDLFLSPKPFLHKAKNLILTTCIWKMFNQHLMHQVTAVFTGNYKLVLLSALMTTQHAHAGAHANLQ